MKKGIKLLLILSVAFALMSVPAVSGLQISKTNAVAFGGDTEKITCTIGGEKVTRWISLSTIESVVEIGKDCKVSFLTIFNKWAPEEEVQLAFDQVSVFFDALIDNDLTDKTSDELEDLFWNIRNRIRKPRKDPSSLISSFTNPDDPQPLGGQNGIPTPIFGNIGCGVFSVGLGLGFTLGTNTLIPTIGADLFTTWASGGETISIGQLGFTTSTTFEFGLILGFIGVLLATPIMILGPFLQVGGACAYIGAGPMPF